MEKIENILEEKKVDHAVADLLHEQLYKIRPFEDKIWVTGLCLLSFSLIVFLVSAFSITEEGAAFGAFALVYLAAIVYFFIIKANRKYLKRQGIYRSTFAHSTLLLVILLVSAYSLNRSMFIFQDSTTWLSVYVVASALPYAFFPFYQQLPKALQVVFQVLLGASLVLWVYLSIYLIPIYHIGIFGSIALGISLHTFLPLLLFIYGIRVVMRTGQYPWAKIGLSLGIAFPLVFAVYFMFHWQRINNQITDTVQRLETEDYNQLPGWVRVSQVLDNSWITERAVKSDLVYVTYSGDMNWGFNPRQFNEVKKHDPLVNTASYFLGQTNLSRDEKIKILETTYDARHQAQEKLWSGENLQTAGIVTRTRIYPAYRLAYTEKVIRIKNTSTNQWRNEQEALYTFHLPEGAVVTSLSLWINNREEKGYLTTKSKADSAYTTIVGVEVRDPSVVHWQEGNTVVVRVFPCTSAEERQFKIGLTAPLRQEKDKLVYENFYFEGPTATKATEQIYVQFDETPQALQTAFDLKQEPNNSYRYSGSYNPDWQFSFKAPALNTTAFSFAGTHYALAPLTPAYAPFRPAAIYLDVNEAWLPEEWKAIIALANQQKLYAVTDGFTQITPQNEAAFYEQLKQHKFSLFPIHQIPNPAQALLITKSSMWGPNLHDLKDTDFAVNLKSFLQQSPRLRVYNLSFEKSAYIKTLKELRILLYDEGDPEKLLGLLQKQTFVKDVEDAATVVLDDAKLKITATAQTTSAANAAPDHLLRLFAYNDIMKRVSKTYFQADAATDELIAEAQQANVVSPVSSLVVLETKQDYERFGISQSKNSLGNASAKAAGAVPEPHVWALIIMAVLLISWLLLKPRLEPGLFDN